MNIKFTLDYISIAESLTEGYPYYDLPAVIQRIIDITVEEIMSGDMN